jgi:ribosomal protein S18 acetylase RimI-like enzyme
VTAEEAAARSTSDSVAALDDAAAAAALDANFAELIRWYASRPGGEVVENGDVTTCSTGLAFRSINCAVAIDLDPATADERIAEVGAWFGARGLPWRWLVGPTSRPLDLGERLLRAGLELVGDGAGMALDLGRCAPEPEPLPAGVTIETVDDLAGLAAWEELQRRALELDETRARAWRDAHDRALSADVPLRDWIARLDGAPVAAAALFVAGGVAGIYNVATVPEARGRGIGRAITAAALAEGVARGQRTAVLGSSEMGYPVYRRLGFREVSRLRSYAWGVSPGR